MIRFRVQVQACISKKSHRIVAQSESPVNEPSSRNTYIRPKKIIQKKFNLYLNTSACLYYKLFLGWLFSQCVLNCFIMDSKLAQLVNYSCMFSITSMQFIVSEVDTQIHTPHEKKVISRSHTHTYMPD